MANSNELKYGEDYKYIPATSVANGKGYELHADIYCHTIQIVNITFIGNPNAKEFVLVDAGMPGSVNDIISTAEKRFGKDYIPRAIILTHGHFDHVGAILELIERWSVPVFAHEEEIPFLTGKKSYPNPDPTVEGGIIAKISPLFPNEPIHLGSHVEKLPSNGNVPHLPDFRWIHTPGHTPGHVSLFREDDRTLIAGDAFVTVRQDSLYKVLVQDVEISGPPRYFTSDWKAAFQSVKKCTALQPSVAITGHGIPMTGDLLSKNLHQLVHNFEQIAIPDYGKYVTKN